MSKAPTVAALEPGSIVAGYRVVGPLAAGAMGAVYVAEQLATKKQRALKVMQPALVEDDKARERFAQEAQIGAGLESEHIVEVIDAGIDAARGTPWLAMELLKGETVAARVAREGPLPVGVVRELLAQLCHALGAAHDRGIVHRDLKPENLFLAAPRREGVPFTLKVLDFGIAKMVSEAQTHFTGAIGTPLFMAPEQMVPGRRVAPATDVWALGLIAFRLLTGEYYWRAARNESPTAMMLLNEVANLPLEPASARARELGAEELVPAGFDDWFARAVTRDLDDRFRDARAARSALEPVLAACGEGASAPRAPHRQRAPAPASSSADVATDLWLAAQSAEEAPPAEPGAGAAVPAGPGAADTALASAGTVPVRATATVARSRRNLLALGAVAVVVAGGAVAASLAVGRPSAPAEVPTSGASAAVAVSSATATATAGRKGRLPTEVIRTVVASHYRYLRECFAAALVRLPRLEGLVNMHFTIEEAGDVEVTSTEGSTITDPEVLRCVSERFGSIGFPKPDGGVVTVIYPIAFTPDPSAEPAPAPSASAR
ncbi:MAG: serine/threonine protein kinase [Polyangiaceae bacterium]|nr:serine/threonine protein kinase [Polyangiaceae bacterium]